MDQTYYNKGSSGDIWISNSFFSALNPEQGGSPQKALAFLDNKLEQLESKGVENGKTIHLYMEDKEKFVIASVPRPSDMLGDMLDEFHNFRSRNLPIDNTQEIEITSKLKTENGRTAEILATKASFEKLAMLLKMDYKSTVILFREARNKAGAYKSYNEGTLSEKFINEGIDYLNQAKNLEGKLTLTVPDQVIIEGATTSLYNNTLAHKYYNLSKLPTNNIVLKEVDIFFNINSINCKAKIDNIYIDIENKTIYINDLKTTSKPLGLFRTTLEYYRYYRQLAWYKLALSFYLAKYYPQYTEYTVVCNIIAVETIDNFQSCVFNVDAYIPKGREEGKALLERAMYHIKNKIWNMSMEAHQGNGVIKLIPDDSK